MLEGSFTTSDQGNISQPLAETYPIKDEIDESEVTIAMLYAEIRRAERRVGFYLYGILAIIGVAVFVVYWSSFHRKELLDALDVNPNNLYIYLFFGSLKADRDFWTIKKRITRQFAANFERPSYFDSLVRINVENLAAFYALVKGHTDRSYKVAIRVCVFGFCLMVIGLAVGITNISSSPLGSYITTASGVITVIIAGVFFSVYNRTTRQIKGYYDSLLTVQNTLLSFKLIEEAQDENEKAKIGGQILANLIHKQSSSSLTGNEQASQYPATVNRIK